MTAPTTDRMRTDRMLAAFHEAGHTVACFEFGIAMSTAELMPALLSDDCAGVVRFAWWITERNFDPRHDAVMSLAGPEAERIYRARHEMGEPDVLRWEGDMACVRAALEKDPKLTLIDMRTQAHRLVSRRWAEVHDIGMLLERRRRINANQARTAARKAS